ncbi:unnamed protein product [Adineta ricciae]|uniref:Uncharacterized protein n=1 Tax=Adineta ricciae TaxID=249248 RepID=A0A816HN95_ADIRI|nr:unnamed protein product [Adineta ricciae]
MNFAWVTKQQKQPRTHAVRWVCMDQWLSKLITGDEKWVLYVNYTRERHWLSTGQTGVATPKADPHPKKLMLSV